METIETKITEFIELIKSKMKEMGLNATDVFLNGNCGNLYKLFVEHFPRQAIIPYVIKHGEEQLHMVSQINGKFYDITGETDLDKYYEYVKKNHPGHYKFYDKEEFSIQKLEPSEREKTVREMSDKYDYDEEFKESSIKYEMSRLKNFLNQKHIDK